MSATKNEQMKLVCDTTILTDYREIVLIFCLYTRADNRRLGNIVLEFHVGVVSENTQVPYHGSLHQINITSSRSSSCPFVVDVFGIVFRNLFVSQNSLGILDLLCNWQYYLDQFMCQEKLCV